MAVVLPLATLLGLPPSAAASRTPEWTSANYELNDGTVAFVAWTPAVLGYREGDSLVVARRQAPGRYVSDAGYEVAVVGEAELRVVSPSGLARSGRKVELSRIEEVRFRNGDVTLAGSLFVPHGPGPHPAIAMAQGSGDLDRGGLLGYADLFARSGVAALVYDKRGTGASTGTYSVMGSYHSLAGDLLAGVEHLKARTDIDAGRIGVWGLSEGGLVAPLAASRSSDVAFVVAVSAPGVGLIRSVLWQTEQSLRRAGVSGGSVGADVKAMGLLYRAARALGFDGAGPESWDLDPAAVFETVRQPVLLVYGERDRLVPPARSATVIGEALRRGGNRDVTVQAFPGADHGIFLHESGFRPAKDAERGLLQIAPGFQSTVVKWVTARTRGDSIEAGPSWRPERLENVRDVDRRPWHESPALHLGPGLAFLGVFLVTVVFRPARWLLQRPRPAASPPSVRRARVLAGLVAGSGLVALAGLVGRVVASVFGAALPGGRVALQVWGVGTAALVVALVACTSRAWGATWPGRSRLAHGVVMVAAAALVPYLAYWRVLV